MYVFLYSVAADTWKCRPHSLCAGEEEGLQLCCGVKSFSMRMTSLDLELIHQALLDGFLH